MRYIKYLVAAFSVFAVVFVFMSLSPAHSSAFSSQTGGDGYIPFVYQGKIYNVSHHQTPSGDPANPKYDLHCTLPSGQVCTGYPVYFSSDNGSTGNLTSGTAGTADIYTSTIANATIIGSKLYYAGQRVSDNGIGCFDLSTNLNCGYFQLGSLAVRTGYIGSVYPSMVDGIEAIGNRLYSLGDDLNMYCLDITVQNSPVACAGQPFSVNSGITGTMPAATLGLTSRIIHNGLIYMVVNYNSNTTPADARVTCYDPSTDSRCSGWSSLDVTSSAGSQNTLSLFEYPDTSGVVSSFCVDQVASITPQCWNFNTQASVPAPPGLFDNITTSVPVNVRNVLRIGNVSYIALEGATFVNQDAMAVCYNFTTQARCSGFGSGGVKRWDGSDGDPQVAAGGTRDYGYAQFNNNCLVGLGDGGVLWSFVSQTGHTSEILDCSDVLNPSAKIAAPDTGSQYNPPKILLYGSMVVITGAAIGIRHTYLSYRRK